MQVFGLREILVGLGLLVSSSVSALEYEIQSGKPSQVRFDSEAVMENFTGKTREVSGTIRLDPQDLEAGIQVTVSVDLTSLKTGIPIRDAHMRDNHLETDTYPTATFNSYEVQELSKIVKDGHTIFTFDLLGKMTLHGVTRNLTAVVELFFEEKDIHVRSTFVVHLEDFKITRPKFLFLKLSETQDVTLDLVAKPVAELKDPQ